MSRKLTDSQEQTVCERYEAGESGWSIARAYDVSGQTVYNVLERRGVAKRKDASTTSKESPIFRATQQAAIARMYAEGLSIQTIADRHACGNSAVRGALNREGIARRTQAQTSLRYQCDWSFFYDIDTEEKAYWLGFIGADGYVHERTNRLVVKLAARDREHLHRLKHSLGSTHPIMEYSVHGGRVEPQLTICSRKLVLGLAVNGVAQGKTFSLKWPEYLPDNLLRHYLRGLVDGDGSFFVGNKKYRSVVFSLIGSLDSLAGARAFLTRTCVLPERKIGGGTWLDPRLGTLRYGSQEHVRRISQLLYDDATIYLPRKREKVAHLVEN